MKKEDSLTMPTYKNIRSDKQKIDQSLQNINGEFKTLYFNKSIETYIRYGDKIDDLLLVSETPYWNPVINSSKIILADSDDFQVVSIDKSVYSIEIINTSSETIFMYYQSYENIPGIPIPSGLTRNLSNFNRFANQLVFKSTGAVMDNEVFITQFQE